MTICKHDFANGIVKTDGGHVLGKPLMQIAEARSVWLASHPGHEVTDTLQLFEFPNTEIGGATWFVQTRFTADRIDIVLLSAKDPPTRPFDARAEKAKHYAMLIAMFGARGPFEFAWGTIRTELDDKGGAGPLVFAYRMQG
jgi:hypothetical protein